jgi:hypothetical protein
MMGKIAASFLLIVTNDCLAQQFGTAGGYNELVRAQRRGQQEEQSRKDDTKLSLSGSQYTNPRQSDSLDLDTLKIGDTGCLSYWRFTVLRILDATNCVISIGSGDRRRTFVLSQYPTEQIVDDMRVFLADDIVVSGAQMVGARKYMTLQFVPPQKKRNPQDPDLNKDITPITDASSDEHSTHTWTDETGQFQISAKLIDVKENTVLLERDQKQIDIPLSRLSSNDQAYVRGEMQRRKQ